MRRIMVVALAGLLLGACGEDEVAEAPPPLEPTREAIGHYCNMIVLDHPGPKGQVFLADHPQPYWFSSARDTIAFTMLPEESRDILAIYVSDMGRAESWEKPGPGAWVDARQAFYVIGSDKRGGMGQAEAVPFSTREAAERFVGEHGGRIVAFSEIPRDYILGSDAPAPDEAAAPSHEHANGK